MTSDWLFIFVGVTVLSAVGFVFVALLWLRRLRENVLNYLSETAGQQILTARRLDESISELQKQQENCAMQIQTLAHAGLRLQQEISNVSNRLSSVQTESARGGQTLH